MTWFNLLKQPKLRTSSNITTQLGTSEKEEDEQCRKKIKEYLNKIKTMGGPNIKVTVDDSYLDKFGEEELCILLRKINEIDTNNLKTVKHNPKTTLYRKETSADYDSGDLKIFCVLYYRESHPDYKPYIHAPEHSVTWYILCVDTSSTFNYSEAIMINISVNADELGEKEALKAVDFR
mgnify:CR=1 FL=1